MYDVAVVGNGLAGALSTSFLSNRGCKVAWYQMPATQNSFSSNLSHHIVLNYGSLRRLKNIGIRPEDLDGHLLKRYCLLDRNRQLYSISHSDLSLDYLGIQVSISKLAKLLLSSIRDDKVQIYDSTLVQELKPDIDKVSIVSQNSKVASAKYLLVADGQRSHFRDLLSHDCPQSLCADQFAMTLHLKYQRPLNFNIEDSLQIIQSQYLIGVIPHSEDTLTVVITGDRDELEVLLGQTECQLKSKIESFLPVHYRCIKELKYENNLKRLSTYTMSQSYFSSYAFLGLAAKGLHPAGAMGFNHIIYEASLLDHFIGKVGLLPDRWVDKLNQLTCDRFTHTSGIVRVLSQKQYRQYLPFLSLTLFPKNSLSHAIA